MSSPLARLLRQLSAGFSNQQQAFDNPPLYAHILVKFRPLPQLEPGSLLLDQSYAINPAAPYRLRVLKAEQRGGAADQQRRGRHPGHRGAEGQAQALDRRGQRDRKSVV